MCVHINQCRIINANYLGRYFRNRSGSPVTTVRTTSMLEHFFLQVTLYFLVTPLLTLPMSMSIDGG